MDNGLILGLPWQECVGLLASLLVLVSFLTRKQMQLRVINLIGCAAWITYGLLIGAFSVWFMNTLVGLIQVWYIVSVRAEKYRFWFVNCRKDDGMLNRFIDSNYTDILQVQPSFLKNLVNDEAKCFYIMRENEIAGVFILNPLSVKAGSYEPVLWYTTKKYRDNLGNDIYEGTKEYFKTHGIQEIAGKPDSDRYQQYLQQSGYSFDNDNKVFVLQ